MPCIETVETWMKLDKKKRQDSKAKRNYLDTFSKQMKNSMDGYLDEKINMDFRSELLEP